MQPVKLGHDLHLTSVNLIEYNRYDWKRSDKFTAVEKLRELKHFFHDVSSHDFCFNNFYRTCCALVRIQNF